MPIAIADDNDDFLDEDSSYNFRQLMDTLLANKDIIVTVPSDQVVLLRAGLIMRKSKDNKKAVRNGLLPNDEMLSFQIYPAKDKLTKQDLIGQTCIRVKLAPKRSITVLDIEVPDDGF